MKRLFWLLSLSNFVITAQKWTSFVVPPSLSPSSKAVHPFCAHVSQSSKRSQIWREISSPSYKIYRDSHPNIDDSATPLIDLRDESDFRAQHLNGATSIPLLQLAARMFELPPPYEEPIRLFGNQLQLEEAEKLLTSRGWNVEEKVFSEGDSVWAGSCEMGDGSRPIWKPSAFLAEVLEMEDTQAWQSEKTDGVAIDVGCGAGRDMVLLAQHLGESWKVLGLDNDKGALDRAAALSRREDVTVELVEANIRKEGMGGRTADLVHGCRFLDRSLLAQLSRSLLRPGGMLVWSTFLQGHRRVRPGRSLERGELRRQFSAAQGWELVVDREGTLFSGGDLVPASFFAARRHA